MIEYTAEYTCNTLTKNIATLLEGHKAVIGISGGKDSAVAAALCVRAVGKENVIGLLLPDGKNQINSNDFLLAKKLCEYLGIEYHVIDIFYVSEYIRVSIAKTFNTGDKLTNQCTMNIAPRIRMTYLYAFSQNIDGRVINTSNKTESALGYYTLWGDGAGDIAVLSELQASDVVKLGKYLGLPDEIVNKAPADGLSDKTDEEKWGYTYADVENVVRNFGVKPEEESDPIRRKIKETIIENSYKPFLPKRVTREPIDIERHKQTIAMSNMYIRRIGRD